MHFRREYETSAAQMMKRKRAGRYGRMQGEGTDEEDSEDDSDYGDSSENSDEEEDMEPKPDEK